MSAAIETAKRNLSQLSKSELVSKLARLREGAKRLKVREHAQRAGRTLVGGALAATGGGIAGALQSKMPVIPKTKISSDLAAGGILLGLVASDVFGNELEAHMSDVAKGLIGAGTAPYAKKFFDGLGK